VAPSEPRGWARRIRELTGGSVGGSRKGIRFDAWRQVVVILATGVFMALAGPFGTDHGTLAVRLAYWLGLMSVGTVLANSITVLAVRIDLFERRPWLWAVVVGALISPPLTIVVWLVTGLVFALTLRADTLLGYAPPVIIISMAMMAITVLTQRTPAQTHARAADGAPAAFLARLPAKLRGAELWAVQAEDHYLRVHTSRGQDLILMRLADALGELDGLEGAQVHRSWWVARGAVVGAQRGNGRAELALKDGSSAPVSRTYARALRAAGWF